MTRRSFAARLLGTVSIATVAATVLRKSVGTTWLAIPPAPAMRLVIDEDLAASMEVMHALLRPAMLAIAAQIEAEILTPRIG